MYNLMEQMNESESEIAKGVENLLALAFHAIFSMRIAFEYGSLTLDAIGKNVKQRRSGTKNVYPFKTVSPADIWNPTVTTYIPIPFTRYSFFLSFSRATFLLSSHN